MGGQGITIASSYLIKLSLIVCAPSAFCRSCQKEGEPLPLSGGGEPSSAAPLPARTSGRTAPPLPGNAGCGGEGGPAARGRDAGPGPGPRAVPHHRQGRAAPAGLQPPLTAGATGPGEPWPAAESPRTPPLPAAPPGALFAAAAPGPCGLLVGRGSRASPVPSLLSPCPAPLPPRRGRRAACVDSRAVFIVFPLGTQGFRSGYEDYPSEISLL